MRSRKIRSAARPARRRRWCRCAIRCPNAALPDADEVIYVVAGEGTLRLGNTQRPAEGHDAVGDSTRHRARHHPEGTQSAHLRLGPLRTAVHALKLASAVVAWCLAATALPVVSRRADSRPRRRPCPRSARVALVPLDDRPSSPAGSHPAWRGRRYRGRHASARRARPVPQDRRRRRDRPLARRTRSRHARRRRSSRPTCSRTAVSSDRVPAACSRADARRRLDALGRLKAAAAGPAGVHLREHSPIGADRRRRQRGVAAEADAMGGDRAGGRRRRGAGGRARGHRVVAAGRHDRPLPRRPGAEPRGEPRPGGPGDARRGRRRRCSAWTSRRRRACTSRSARRSPPPSRRLEPPRRHRAGRRRHRDGAAGARAARAIQVSAAGAQPSTRQTPCAMPCCPQRRERRCGRQGQGGAGRTHAVRSRGSGLDRSVRLCLTA